MNPEERVPLGRTTLAVTRLGLGTAPLAGLYRPVEEDEAIATIERSLELGLRFFDTAPVYGYGLAERRLGRVLAQRHRETFALATKVGRLLRESARPDESQYFEGEPFYKETPQVNPVFDFSHAGVLQSLEESLERLGLDSVDVVHIHDPDDYPDQALNEAFPALDLLREEGAIRAIGAGMNQAEMLARFAREADFDCFLLAGRYTLLDQIALRELLPLCVERDIAVIAGGVYNSGILANPGPGAHYDYMPAPPELIERAQRIEAVCSRHGVPLKAAAVQFPLGHPAVACVVIGSRSVAELEENVDMFRHPIPADLWQELKFERLLPEEAPVPEADGPSTQREHPGSSADPPST